MRSLLLSAAGRLVAEGQAPSITEVADAAEVSRRTAYRYFPTQEQLLTEVALERLRPQVQAALDKAGRYQSPAEILDAAVGAIQGLAVENQALLRTILRQSLDRQLGGQQANKGGHASVRGSRRVNWIEAALAPVRPSMAPSLFETLVSALTLCVGIESLITLRDVRSVTDKRAISICRWAAGAMLDKATKEQQQSPKTGTKPGKGTQAPRGTNATTPVVREG